MDPRDDAPPAKRRRTSYEPKPRSTEFLSLPESLDHLNPADKEQLDKLLKVLNKKRKIVVVAGAGISVSAGSE
jgi:NAD+-dependent protein deacetylase SIR2